MCSCWWQWKSVRPGLSATKSTSASWYPPNITTSFKIPAVGFPARLVSSKLWRCRWIGWIPSLALRIRMRLRLPLLHVKRSRDHLVAHGEGRAVDSPPIEAFLGGVVLREDHLDRL